MKKNKLKVYAIFSNSHEILYKNYFLPSLKNTDLELIVEKFEQIGSGICDSAHWNEIMMKKVEFIIETIKGNWGDIFVCSDIDIIFLKNVSKDLIFRLKGKDIVFQTERIKGNEVNCGFYACRANENSLKLWQECKSRFKEEILQGVKTNEQIIINKILLENSPVKFGLLPLGKYYSPRMPLDIDDNVIRNMPEIPQNICTYHANFLYDLRQKETVLLKVKEIINKHQGISMTQFYFSIYKKRYVTNFNYAIGFIGITLKRNCPIIYNLLKPYFSDKK